jgi:exodeoxyribonuclease V alpha subunit
MITIEGILEGYLYKNPENGYCVAAISGGIKAVGILPDIRKGENLKLTGDYINHPKFGKQFSIESYSIILPDTRQGIIKYLGSGFIKGVGPSIAERIVKTFGEKSLEILDENPDRLLKIEGIGKAKLSMIKKSWEEQKSIKDVMLFLQSYNISPFYALKIFRAYGKDSIKIVQDNPYQLTYDVFGIGFKTADTIAKTAGFMEDHPKRIKAGVVYALNEAANDGHVYLPLQELVRKCFDLLGVDLSDSLMLFRELEEKGRVKIINENIYLSNYYHSERNIEYRLTALLNESSSVTEKELNSIKLKKGYYSDEQIGAIRSSLTNKILILTGGPGTGKTTTIKGIIDSYKYLNKNIMLAAPTGRAAKRMSEVIGFESRTIHRLLEYNPVDRFFARNEDNPLETDLLVIDEVSMIDIMLMNSLVNAVGPGTTLIFVGDADQLPSVGPGNILNDLIKADIIPTVKLTKIFRQAEESNIVVNAHKINRGEFPFLVNGEKSDFFFIQETDNSRLPELIVDLCVKRLPEKYGFDPMKDIQVLTPMYKGPAGADNLNNLLQAALNRNEGSHTRGSQKFRTGDKVMQLRNNYDKDVFNGDIGIIYNIDNDNQKMDIIFNGRIISYEFNELEDITLAYAITVHKSQGSEYPCVIVPVTTAHYIMLQRNLLYTAVTRASKMMIIVGTKQALAMAVGNKKAMKRYTSLFAINNGIAE